MQQQGRTTACHKNETRNRSRRGPLAVTLIALALIVPAALAQTAAAAEAPAISKLDPESGPAGTYFYIEGEGFARIQEVRFGDFSVSYDYFSDNLLGLSAPEAPADQYEITVTGPDGEADACCFTVTEEDNASVDEESSTDEGSASNGETPDETTPANANKDAVAKAGDPCHEPGKNIQCNELGVISMDSRYDIRGEPADVKVEIKLNHDFEDQGARWIMFSLRNNTAEGSPVTIQPGKFATQHGEVLTTRVEHETPNELNIWVHVLDVPVGETITLTSTVGVTDRGAFTLEMLVLVFDRGYEPIKNSDGEDLSLFSFALLGVNQETGATNGGGLAGSVPGFGVVAFLGATIALAGIASRRRKA